MAELALEPLLAGLGEGGEASMGLAGRGAGAPAAPPLTAADVRAIGRHVVHHGPTLLMVPLLAFAVLFVLLGAVMLARDDTGAGSALAVLGLLLGGGALYIITRWESSRARARARGE